MKDHEREIEAWRAFRRDRVGGPDGWLAVEVLWWLSDGPTSIGSERSNDVVLASGPAHLGTVIVGQGQATFDPGGDQPPVGLVDDADGRPTVLRFGPRSLTVIRRSGRLGLRVRNAESRSRQSFRGLRYFPVDGRWRVEARLEPTSPGRTVSLATVLDTVETYAVAGTLRFDLPEGLYSLEAYVERGETDLFVMFGDLTNGRETFGGGRYLYARPPGPDGVTVVDFNRSYNPPCVFTPHATCALPPSENRLPIRVEAGELRYDDEPSH